MHEHTALAFAIKPLSMRDLQWARKVTDSGVPLVVDLCDNVFIHGYGGQGDEVGRRFADIASLATAVTVPTAALGERTVRSGCIRESRVHVVPDIVETPALLDREGRLVGQPAPRRAILASFNAWLQRRSAAAPVLIWFGNHGARHGSFGIGDLALFEQALEQASTQFGARLWVVSNNRARFEEVARTLPIPCEYFEWTPTIVDQLLPRARVCLVPNSQDEFSITKSPNRALKALHAGVPVVATPTPSYAFLDEVIAFGDPTAGVLGYLADPALARDHVRRARAVLEKHYSMTSLRNALTPVVEQASAGWVER